MFHNTCLNVTSSNKKDLFLSDTCYYTVPSKVFFYREVPNRLEKAFQSNYFDFGSLICVLDVTISYSDRIDFEVVYFLPTFSGKSSMFPHYPLNLYLKKFLFHCLFLTATFFVLKKKKYNLPFAWKIKNDVNNANWVNGKVVLLWTCYVNCLFYMIQDLKWSKNFHNFFL